jgi:rare lipoprotein A
MTPAVAAGGALLGFLRLASVATPPAPYADWCPALGRAYGPPVYTMTGLASWYGTRFRGRRTTSGERFDPKAMTAAHHTWRLGTRVRVTCLRTGRSVVVRINDRLGHPGRVVDLSRAAASELGLLGRGLGRVRLDALEE